MACSATYTPVTVSGYNASPPPDDGSAVAANVITWDFHKSKLGDPLKTALEAINTNVVAFASAVNTCLAGITALADMTCVIATKSASQTGVASGTPTKITFDSEEYDAQNEFASSTFTAAEAGRYQINAGYVIDPNGGAGTSTYEVLIYKNAAEFIKFENTYDSSGQTTGIYGATILNLAASDTIEIYAEHDTGFSEQVRGDAGSVWQTFLTIVRVQ